MSLFERLRPNREPVRLGHPSVLDQPPAPTDQKLADTLAELAVTRRQIDALNLRVVALTDLKNAAERRARDAELLIGQLTIAGAGSATDQVARMRRTLIDYEDQLATCRQLHGGNTRSGALPARHGAPDRHPLARCEFCRQPVAGPLDACQDPDCLKKSLDVEMAFVRREDV